jgi:hypothetical protein
MPRTKFLFQLNKGRRTMTSMDRMYPVEFKWKIRILYVVVCCQFFLVTKLRFVRLLVTGSCVRLRFLCLQFLAREF